MGKNKNKKHDVDYFNMTPEEQMANAEIFNEYEKGEASFLDALNYKVPSGVVAQSDYKRQIEEACLGIKDTDNEDNYIAELSNAMNRTEQDSDNSEDSPEENVVYEDIETGEEYIRYADVVTDDEFEEAEEYEDDEDDNDDIDDESEEESVDVYTHDSKSVDSVSVLNKVKFSYNPVVDKMNISDGYTTTSVSVHQTKLIDIDNDSIPEDGDALSAIISKLFFYIISCKYPSVIMTEETFEMEFSLYSSIDTNRFVFFKYDGYVFLYIVDAEEVNNFYDIVDKFNMEEDIERLLQYIIGSAIAVDNIHNKFMYLDEEEILAVMSDRHEVKEFIKLVESDSNTKYAGHNVSGDVLSRMGVTDLRSLVNEANNIINEFTDECDDDTDEYDEDDDVEEYDEEDDDDVDVSDFPDIDEIESVDVSETTVTTTSNVNITKTSVSGGETININKKDGEMVLPVIHRRQ